jgi:carbon-monoxide dehydrogenase medium subunit
VKSSQFEYDAPTEIDEVTALLDTYGEDARLLAGGQSLVPLLAFRLARFDRLIDLNRVAALSSIDVRDGRLAVGAMTRQATIHSAPEISETVPLLHEATKYIGHFQIRNRGTLGGSIAHADPAAEYPAVALALDASVGVTSSEGERQVPIGEFLDSAYTTTLEPEELITSLCFPVARPREGFAIEELARRHGDFALAGAVAAVWLSANGSMEDVRIALFGVSDCAVRLTPAEQAMEGQDPAEAPLRDMISDAVRDVSFSSDVQVSAEYRAKVAPVIAERALRRALVRAERDDPR